MSRVANAMRRHGIARTEIDQFLSECRSGDYDHLLRTCMEWCNLRLTNFKNFTPEWFVITIFVAGEITSAKRDGQQKMADDVVDPSMRCKSNWGRPAAACGTRG
jgi:hypothetical protein